jgi:ribose 5-phosphate isomerase B
MRVHLGSDHAGFELKQHLVGWLAERGHQVIDHGADSYQAGDDYPPYCLAAAEAVVADPGSLGIVIGGSGNGEQIAANKVKGVRAALAWSEETARLSRQHNDANVVGIGARMHTIDQATLLVEVFLSTPFSQDPRHQRRITEVAEYEETGAIPEVASPRPD